VVEVIREACTLVVLGAVAWLAGRRWAHRVGAFLLLFGLWDLTYYAGLKLMLGWPESLGTWDILFLIPVPWVAPVWAPAMIAGVFVVAGSYVFWTAQRPRRYRGADMVFLFTSALAIFGAFVSGWRIVPDQQPPQRFPLWLFWSGVILGTSWFVHAERRAVAVGTTGPHPLRVPIRSAGLPDGDFTEAASNGSQSGSEPGERRKIVVGDVLGDYSVAKRRLEALLNEASNAGERFERLAHGLLAHPRRVVIGAPDPFGDEANEWDVVSNESLPPIERLMALTDDIRETARRVNDLRERLILLGHADVVQQPDEFFQ
jgi:hypothetical protein